jgi:ribonuclease BN (tRNA processing enzyme)
MSSSLSVRVVGVGDAFTARYYNACLLFEAGGTRVLVDAPPALARALRDLSITRASEPAVGLDDIDHVLITHLHGDHVGGLEQLLFWRRFVTGRKATLHAVPEVLAGLWDTRLRGGMDTLLDAPEGPARTLSLEDYADVRPLGPGENRVGGLVIEHRKTIHHIPTSALRVRSGARVIGYSADTAFDPGLVAWLEASDLFFHETNLGVHTPLASLAALPAETRARMRLIHYPDFFDVDDVDGSPIACAREGERYEP